MFSCNLVKDWCSDITKGNVINMYFYHHLLKYIYELAQLYNCVTSCTHTHTKNKNHIKVLCSLEQNVYSNQKEELDKRLNH